MSHPVITLKPSDTTKDALVLMTKNNIGSIVIVDEDNMPVNIITEKDIINLIDKDFQLDPSIKISNLPIKKNLFTIFETDSYDDAVNVLTTNNIHHLIVIDYSGTVVGILSTRDILVGQKELNRFFPYFPNASIIH